MRLRLASVTAMLLLAVASSSAPSECIIYHMPRVQIIQGAVLDESGTEPVPLANVEVIMRKAEHGEVIDRVFSDSNGQFRLRQMPIGRYFVRFQKVGYTAVQGPVEVSTRAPIQQGVMAYLSKNPPCAGMKSGKLPKGFRAKRQETAQGS